MAKYKTEFKIKVVKEYLEGNIGYKGLAKKYSIPDHSTVRTWVNVYESQGYEGLKVSRKNNSYSLNLKLNIVDLYLTGEMSYQSLASEFKINNPSMIARWVREEGIEGLKSKKRGRPSNMPNTDKSQNLTNKSNKTKKELSELEKLREENYYLQMEVEILKKKIQFSQMTESEIDEYLRSLDH